jgi:hypothetical protein
VTRLQALSGLIAACEAAPVGIPSAVDDALEALRTSPPLAEDALVEAIWHEGAPTGQDAVRFVLAALDARLKVTW